MLESQRSIRQFSVLNEFSHVWGQKGLRDLHMYVFCITTGTSNRISSTFLSAPATADKSIPIRNQPSAAFLPGSVYLSVQVTYMFLMRL